MKTQAEEIIKELFNVKDINMMRPIDLLAFRIDDDHKMFIKEYHGEQKNFKIAR